MPETETKTIKVAHDVAALKAKLAKTTLTEEGKVKATDRTAGHDAAEQRRKAREAAKTADEKQALLDTVQAELDEAKKEVEAAKTRISELEPAAKNWSKHESAERARLIEKLPPELRAEYKDLPTNNLRSVVKLATGETTTKTEQDKSKGTGTDWMALYTGDDEAAFNKAMEADPKGWDEFLKTQTK
jgi:predicted  nucleic acid-binding Zn-ribbon protein